MNQNAPAHRPLLVQAPVRALDPDGVSVVTTGTIGFAIGAGVCRWTYPELAAVGRGWYLDVALAGTAIGLLGLAFSLFRVARRRRRTAGAVSEDPAGVAPPRRAIETPAEDDDQTT